ncbi:hypothetical protein U1Q18_036427, partial [Sarracenia purpurea var. burkii]
MIEDAWSPFTPNDDSLSREEWDSVEKRFEKLALKALGKAKKGQSPLNETDLGMVIDWLAWYRRSPSTDEELSPSEKKSKGGVASIQRQVLKDLDLGDIEGKNEVGFCSVEAVAVTPSTVAINEVSDPDSSKNKGSVLKSRDVSVLGNTVLKSYSSSVSKEGFEASQAESEADEEEDEEVRISRSKSKEESDVNPESEKVPVLEDKIIKIEVVDHCEGKGEVLEVGEIASATLSEGASYQVSTKVSVDKKVDVWDGGAEDKEDDGKCLVESTKPVGKGSKIIAAEGADQHVSALSSKVSVSELNGPEVSVSPAENDSMISEFHECIVSAKGVKQIGEKGDRQICAPQ